MQPPKAFATRLPSQWIYWIVVLGLFASLVLGLIGRGGSGVPARWDHFFHDAYLRHTASFEPARESVVVDIDDVSLSAAGQWPWPRYRMAALVERIADAQPAAIGLDILFAEPDRTSLDSIRQTFKNDFGLDLQFEGVSPGLTDNDGYFAEVLARTGAVGARFFYFDHVNKTLVETRPEFRITGKLDKLLLYDAPGVLDNTATIAAQMKYAGFLNNQPDRDGLVRRVPLLIRHRGAVYPQLALATFMRAQGLDAAVVDEDANGPLIRVGRHVIPIAADGTAVLRFNGPPTLYPALSALEVLRAPGAPEALRGKIVFVGSSAAALNDLHSTIFDAQSPGLKTHAALVENMLAGSFVRLPSWAGTAIVTLAIVSGLLMSALFILLRKPWQVFIGTAALAFAHLGTSLYLFEAQGMFVSPATPMLVTIVLFVLFTTARFAIERNQANVWFRRLANAQQVTMESMAAVAETRDPETGAHIKRTQHYVKSIAESLRDRGHYTELLTAEYIDLLFVSAPLHDIGKVGVPDHILLKPGRLTADEFELMKKHAEYGKEIIYSTAQKIEGDNFLVIAGEIASTHHEKWDGTGYPLGLSGQDIPLSGRIMAVADVYDALISRRCYKAPFPHDMARGMMLAERGRMFDPAVLDAFFAIEDAILRIAARYRDPNESAADPPEHHGFAFERPAG